MLLDQIKFSETDINQYLNTQDISIWGRRGLKLPQLLVEDQRQPFCIKMCLALGQMTPQSAQFAYQSASRLAQNSVRSMR